MRKTFNELNATGIVLSEEKCVKALQTIIDKYADALAWLYDKAYLSGMFFDIPELRCVLMEEYPDAFAETGIECGKYFFDEVHLRLALKGTQDMECATFLDKVITCMECEQDILDIKSALVHCDSDFVIRKPYKLTDYKSVDAYNGYYGLRHCLNTDKPIKVLNVYSILRNLVCSDIQGVGTNLTSGVVDKELDDYLAVHLLDNSIIVKSQELLMPILRARNDYNNSARKGQTSCISVSYMRNYWAYNTSKVFSEIDKVLEGHQILLYAKGYIYYV